MNAREKTERQPPIARVFAIGALAFFAAASPALAQAPGMPGFRTTAEQRREFIEKLRRDIAKVAHAIEVTKELIGRSRGAPYLPDIQLRLAELYIEQARYEFYLVHEERGESAKGSAVAPTARLLKEKAVETYLRILSDWPKFKDADKVLFFLGHEYRELGQYEKMIERYEELVAKHPSSSLVNDAHLVLGDYRFDRQDLAAAKGYYQKILDAPNSPTHDMARFKLGWVYLNESDYKEAFHQFEAAVRSPNDPDGMGEGRARERLVNVKREAIIDLAYAYTEVRKPQGALEYFRELATSRQMYLLAINKLAKRYFIKQEFNAAATVYREIASLSNDAETNLEYTSRVYEADKNAANYRHVHTDVDAMLRALDAFRFDWRVPESEQRAATTNFEQFARDLATKAQSAGLKEKNAKLLSRVATAYTRYLESFRDGAQTAAIVDNLADTLFEAGLYLGAGDRYRESSELANDDEKAREAALYHACVSFHEALRNSAQLSRFDRLTAQNGLARSGLAYVERYPKSDKVPEIKLNIAKSHYDAGKYEAAIGVLDEFLAAYPRHAEAVRAAELVLDSYAQQQKFEALATRAKELAHVPGLGDDAFRRRMLDTAKRSEERQIGEVILTASTEKQAGGDAGEQLRKYWETNRDSPVAERTLYTAFVQYKEARDYAKTFETGNQFIGAYPTSQFLGDVFGTLASFTSQTGDYEKAAVYLEEFYKRFPKDAAAQKMLEQAATIKQLVGDHRGAIASFEELMRQTPKGERKSEFASKVLSSYESLADWEALKAAALSVLGSDRGNVEAQLMVGVATQKLGDIDAAERAFRSAVANAARGQDAREVDAAARAAFLAGDVLYRRFERAGTDGDMTKAATEKAELLGKLEAALSEAVGFNRGEWAVAALHRIALAYQALADFLASAPIPEGLSAEETSQYKQMVAEQAGGLRGRSVEFFDACVTKARELHVYTTTALGCAQKSVERPMMETRSTAAVPPAARRAEIEAALMRDPKNADAIAELTDFFLASKEPAKAKLAAARGLEIDERDARFHNKLGMADLLLGRPGDAWFNFKRAADLNHPYAAANMMAVMVAFDDIAGAKQLAKRTTLDELPAGVADLHPDATSLGAKLGR